MIDPNHIEGDSIRCRVCDATATRQEFTYDPAVWHQADDGESHECDACREGREGWAQECAVTAWEESQR